jgi:hypothetical protein
MLAVSLFQTGYYIGNMGDYLKGLGPLGTIVQGGGWPMPGDFFALFFKVLSTIIGILTISAAIWFVFQFLIGAIQIVSSGGDKTKIQEATTRITNAVVGMVVVVAAIFLISLIGRMMGISILGPWEFIIDLWT